MKRRIVGVPQVANSGDARAVEPIREIVQDLQRRNQWQIVPCDLVVGRNAIQHSLGRAPLFVSVSQGVADATFAWAVVADNPHPDRQVLIDVVGVAAPRSAVLVM